MSIPHPATPRASSTTTVDSERARCTTWRFLPGEETGHHTHEYDYIVVPISGGNFVITDAEGLESPMNQTPGGAYFRLAGVSHNVTSTNARPVEFVEIELLERRSTHG